MKTRQMTLYAVDGLRMKELTRRMVRLADVVCGDRQPGDLDFPDDHVFPSVEAGEDWHHLVALMKGIEPIPPSNRYFADSTHYRARPFKHKRHATFSMMQEHVVWTISVMRGLAGDLGLPAKRLTGAPIPYRHAGRDEVCHISALHADSLPALFEAIERALMSKFETDGPWRDGYGVPFDAERIQSVFATWCKVIAWLTECIDSRCGVIGVGPRR